jgi:hypothetical protein
MKTNNINNTDNDHGKFDGLKGLCQVDLQSKAEIMAGCVQEMVGSDDDSVFLVAVVKGDSYYFFPAAIADDEQKIMLQQKVIDLSLDVHPDSIVWASTAWAAPTSAGGRPSLHPMRKKVIVVEARDHGGRFCAIQEITFSEAGIDCGELETVPVGESWLDQYYGLNHAVVNC